MNVISNIYSDFLIFVPVCDNADDEYSENAYRMVIPIALIQYL